MTTPRPNRFYVTPSPRMLEWITRTHIRLYEATGGALGMAMPVHGEAGGPLVRRLDVLLLGTVGRKTGQRRTAPLPYFQYEGRTFVCASNGASEKHPAWYLNLTATPEVEVQLGAAHLRAVARPLVGEEYQRLWALHTRTWPRWKVYEGKTSRQIPMVELVFGSG